MKRKMDVAYLVLVLFLLLCSLRSDSGADSNVGYAGGDSLGMLTIVPQGAQTPGRYLLWWDSVPFTLYRVQSSSNLLDDAAWNVTDAVLADATNAQVEIQGRSIPENSVEFFRLMAQPEIFGVEPAVVDPNDTNAVIYILGQYLPLGVQVEIGGQFYSPTLINSNGVWAAVRLNGLPLGEPWLSISVVDVGTGATIATLANALQVLPGVSQQLLEPPQEPPAAPYKKDFKGHVTLLKRGDSGSETVRYDVQEGKKGLNAVNVKLARMAGGGDCDDTDEDGGGESMRSISHEMAHPIIQNIRARVAAPGSGGGVMPHSGEVQLCDVDLLIPGRGLDFIWVRTYRSSTGRDTTTMGSRWSHSYDVSVEQDASGIAVSDGTGRRDVYFLGTNGLYARDEFFNEGVLSNNTFTLTFPDTGRWEFNPFGVPPAAGKLARSVDRNGNVMTFAYDGSGRLTNIVDTLGRTNTVAYDVAGHVASLTDFSGRRMTYAYYAGEAGGSPGDLKSVTTPAVTNTPNGNDFPDGKTTTYAYSTGFADERENHLLLTVTDPKGQPSRQFTYEHNTNDFNFLRCVSAQCGTETASCYRWTLVSAPSGSHATIKCFANDPVGNVTEWSFDSRNRCVLLSEFTGRATPGVPVADTVNRPTGKLRAEDPDSYETQWMWNSDSLCTRVTYPGSNATVCLYEREFDKDASPRKKGDLRVLRELASGSGADTDGDGVPDATELTATFQHDPRFGSLPASQGKKLYVGNLPFSATAEGQTVDNANIRDRVNALEAVLKNHGLLTRSAGGINETLPYATLHVGRGWDGTIKGRVVDEDCDGFVVSCTDPRGNVTEASYDSRGNRVKVKFPTLPGGEADFAYNAFGQCIAITNAVDGAGHRRVDTCSYYGSGPQAGFLQSCTEDAAGLAITNRFEYDARGNVTRCVDARGSDTLYTYNALDQTVARQTPKTDFGDRMAATFAYDANDNLVRCDTENRDQNNALDPANPAWTTLYEYDGLDRCTAMAGEISKTHYATNRFFYDGNGNLTEADSPLAALGIDSHNIQAFQYDERGLLFRAVAAPGTGLGSTNEWGYTPNGKIKRFKTELYVETCAYDGFDRRVSVTDAMGNVVTRACDRNGNLVYARCDGEVLDVDGSTGNRRLAETRYQYDAQDRLVSRTDSFFDIFTELPLSDGLSVSTFAYAPNGQLMSATDDNGHTTTCAYDTAGRLASATDARGNARSCLRDLVGNTTSATSTELPDLGGPPQVFTTTYQYDPLNRLIACADAAGNTNRYLYDSRGNVVREMDPRGKVTGRTYDGLCREILLAADTDGDGEFISVGDIVASRTWDDNSRLVSSTDAHSNTTVYAYDSLDRRIAITNADGTALRLVWSPRSNLVGEQDANGTVISNSFDPLDRCVRRDITPAAGVATSTTFEAFTYDGLSRLVVASNDVSRVEVSRDSLGNTSGGVQDGLAHSATHDGVGNCLSLTYPSGRVVTYAYDALDRVTNVATASGGVSHSQLARFAYDGPSRLARIGRDNGINTRLDWDGLVSPPNGAGDSGWRQISRIRHGTVGVPSSVGDIACTYSPTQSKLTKADAGRALDTALTYDALDRLVMSSVSTGGVPVSSSVYTLDGNGNRQQVFANGVAMPYAMDNTLPEPADFQMDQYTLTPFAFEQHDRNGNLVVAASPGVTNYYTYDYADRLVGVDCIAAGSSIATPVVRYSYDPLGRRIGKTTYSPTPVTTQYAYDGDDDCDGILEARQFGNLIDSYIHKLDDGLTMARFAGGTNLAYYHGDEVGNVLALTDAGGNVVERYAYDDYGQPQFLTSEGLPLVGGDGLPVTSSPAGNTFLFRGMEWDGETSLYCGHSQGATAGLRWNDDPYAEDSPRFYDSKTGRYLLRAGVPLRVGANAYAFAGNNPCSGGSPSAMQKGTVKWFNDAKGFGRVAGGGGGGAGGLLAIDSRDILKSFFEKGDKPTQSQFGALIDSMVNRVDDRYLLGLNYTLGKTHTKTGHVTLMK